VDVLQYHDYDEAAWLPVRLGQVTKPILVAELGIEAGSCLPLTERAQRVDVALTGYREAGAAGALLWAFVPDPRTGECTYDIGPGDPVRDVLARHGSR
ncbi:beta-mannosidase, partial [Rhodococcus rhodochrous]